MYSSCMTNLGANITYRGRGETLQLVNTRDDYYVVYFMKSYCRVSLAYWLASLASNHKLSTLCGSQKWQC